MRAYLAVLERDLAGTFNVCSGAPMIVEDLVAPDRLCEATGWSPAIERAVADLLDWWRDRLRAGAAT